MPVSGWTILCDFDGTISVEDVIDSLLDRFGRPGWEALEQDWRAGRIGSRECMSGQVDLLKMTRDELDEHLARCGSIMRFRDFVAKVRELGVPIRVVSDGLDYAIHQILGRYGLDDLPLAANHLSPAHAARINGSSPRRSRRMAAAAARASAPA
jgi:2-hydroxy-3-keto-5-methylthiopentenyl-1-phosphate phosphatase